LKSWPIGFLVLARRRLAQARVLELAKDTEDPARTAALADGFQRAADELRALGNGAGAGRAVPFSTVQIERVVGFSPAVVRARSSPVLLPATTRPSMSSRRRRCAWCQSGRA
jgi:hypothetical protein